MISHLHYISQGRTHQEHLKNIDRMCRAGANWIQLRLKNESFDTVLKTAIAAKAICDSFKVTLIINDFPEVAKQVDACGVHLGKEDTCPLDARAILGTQKIIGGTANTLEDCQILLQKQVDYIGLGPLRFTHTKKNLSPVLGIEGYQMILENLFQTAQVPLIAIGGITMDDIPKLAQCGVHGVAISSGLTFHSQPEKMFQKIFNHFSEKIMNKIDQLVIAGKTFSSRLFTGTGKFSSAEIMIRAIMESQSELVTVALKRVEPGREDDEMLSKLNHPHLSLLPNTSGVRNAKEAVFAAQMAREALGTNWVKVEIHPDPKYLLPDAVETLKACEELVKLGFVVMPYIHADPVLCKRLEEVGAQCVMPLGAPIGSNKGLKTLDFLEIIIEQSNVPVIIDAGIGSPSHAAQAMEIGADAVLVNTAIAVSPNPVEIARAFKMAVEAGRMAYRAQLAPQKSQAEASSPLTQFLYD